MTGYIIKNKGLYVDHVSDGGVDYVSKPASYGYADNLRYMRKQQDLLEKLGQGRGEVYRREVTTMVKDVTLEEVPLREENETTYYRYLKDNKQGVYEVNDYGEITFSEQRYLKMRSKNMVEKVKSMLERYGIEGYKIQRVTEEVRFVLEDE